MKRLGWFGRGLLNTFRKSHLEREMTEELAFHVESRTNDLIRRGVAPPEARRRARMEFGSMEACKESQRDARGFPWLEDLVGDVAYALRSLRRTPAFSVAAITAIALGVTVNAALASLIYAAVFRPLPVMDAPAFKRVSMQTRGDGPRSTRGTGDFVSTAEFAYIRQHSVTSDVAAISQATLSCACADGGRLNAELVSDNLLSVLGATPALGRFFATEEATTPGSAAVAVLSWQAWERHFDRSPEVVGRSFLMNRTPFTVIGVADRQAAGPHAIPADVWIPYTMHVVTRPDERVFENPNFGWLQMFARRRPAVSDGTMQAELEVLGQLSLTPHAPARTAIVTVAPAAFLNYASIMTVALPIASVLLLTVSLVLLIACANVANMLLARGFSRRRETAIRIALGAGPSRLLRQWFTESAVLGLLGGAVGLWLSQVAARILLASIVEFAGPTQLDPSMDWRLTTYITGIALLASLASAIVPARRLLRGHGSLTLTSTDHTDTLRLSKRVSIQGVLVTIQTAVTVVLLVAGGLCLRAFDRISGSDLGQASSNVLVATFDLRQQQYSPDAAVRLHQTVRDTARHWPAVRATALTDLEPFLGSRDGSATLIGDGGRVHELSVSREAISPGFFATMGVTLLRGRDFDQADQPETASRVAIVDERFASGIAGPGDPLGTRLRLDGGEYEIVGVTSATKGLNFGLVTGRPNGPKVYVPMRPVRYREATLAINYTGSFDAIAGALRSAVNDVDPNVVVSIKRVEDNVKTILAPVRLAAIGGAVLGASGLILACTGIYGVVSFALSRRRRELGIRLALGATRGQIMRMMLKAGLRPVLWGYVGGLGVAAAAGQLIRSLLFGVSPFDGLTYAAVVTILIVPAGLATFLPTRTALRQDPITSLRQD
jgi:macrolide transport system ATP-binding/permease protein